jgi:uncharacterized protein (TIGR01777 family)
MANRKIVVAGGTGFIGRRLIAALADAPYDVVVLTRAAAGPVGASDGHASPRTRHVHWDGAHAGAWADELNGAHAVINLAGESVAQRWNASAKVRIRRSRVESVGAICAAVQMASPPPKRWINASAVGIYGDRPNEVVDENSTPGEGFLAQTCFAWEDALFRCASEQTIRTAVRIGFVLGAQGALPVLRQLAHLGLGGPVGSGKQGVSWIHIDDLVAIFHWLIDSEGPRVVNACAPHPVDNRELMSAVRKSVGVRLGLPAPALLVRLQGKVFGPDADLVLSGARAIPAALESAGFRFKFDRLDDALADLTTR